MLRTCVWVSANRAGGVVGFAASRGVTKALAFLALGVTMGGVSNDYLSCVGEEADFLADEFCIFRCDRDYDRGCFFLGAERGVWLEKAGA